MEQLQPAALLCLALLLLPGQASAGDLLKDETIARRRLTRFKVGHADNALCWERHGADGFLSVIDAHNHFRPFFGPAVPWDTYMDWLKSHGILFSTMLGIGQQIIKKNAGAPDCCYYLHCATYDFPVTPDPTNDIENAKDFNKYYKDKPLSDEIHLTPSITFPNLQQPAQNGRLLKQLESDYQGVFQWSGEINVFKHALAANGFFANGNRVSQKVIADGSLDSFFKRMETTGWPTTLHCDLGCDNYDSVPWDQGCFVPDEELVLAKQQHQWWKDFLGPHYRGFFDSTNEPKVNFKKIQHLKVWDSLLTRYPNMTVVWAHLGLSKELKHLHPSVHVHVITKLMGKHRNLYADVSWDVLAKQLFMNHDGQRNASYLHHTVHEDFDKGVLDAFSVNTSELDDLHTSLEDTYDIHREMVKTHGSVTGPTHAMAIYMEMFHGLADRFVTGTDFVSSFGSGEKYPGINKRKGCVKDKKNHARQVTDTSSINMFFNDEAFQKIVLGGNYFRITRLQNTFTPPPVCGDSVLSTEAIIGIGVGAGVLVIIAIIIAVVLICCARGADEGAFIRVGSGSATTNV